MTKRRSPSTIAASAGVGAAPPPGSVAPLAAALRCLADDPALRGAMGAAGRARATRLYDERAVVARTLDLLGL